MTIPTPRRNSVRPMVPASSMRHYVNQSGAPFLVVGVSARLARGLDVADANHIRCCIQLAGDHYLFAQEPRGHSLIVEVVPGSTLLVAKDIQRAVQQRDPAREALSVGGRLVRGGRSSRHSRMRSRGTYARREKNGNRR